MLYCLILYFLFSDKESYELLSLGLELYIYFRYNFFPLFNIVWKSHVLCSWFIEKVHKKPTLSFFFFHLFSSDFNLFDKVLFSFYFCLKFRCLKLFSQYTCPPVLFFALLHGEIVFKLVSVGIVYLQYIASSKIILTRGVVSCLID